ncbi:MAG: histidine kinase, partial [Burkholderiales bacterium PBB5]
MPVTDKYFANAAALPAMPEVAHRLLRSLNDDNIGLGQLSDMIGQDQSLTVKLLRMANSARYSPRHAIATIQDAAATVGLQNLRDLALAACLAGAFPVAPGFDRLRFWRLCLATAGHARVLAQACDLDPDEAYLGGLLLRTGELLMLMTDPAGVAQAEQLAHLPDSLLDHELAVMQCTHAAVSAELARRWRFPDTLEVALGAA